LIAPNPSKHPVGENLDKFLASAHLKERLRHRHAITSPGYLETVTKYENFVPILQVENPDTKLSLKLLFQLIELQILAAIDFDGFGCPI
jgi:hypothetical protein